MLTAVVALLVFLGVWMNGRALTAEVRRLGNQRAIWIGLAILIVGAGIIGFVVFVKGAYSPDPRLRIQGFPIPLVSFVLEKSEWTPFPIQGLMGYFAIAANMFVPILFATWAIKVILRLFRRNEGRVTGKE